MYGIFTSVVQAAAQQRAAKRQAEQAKFSAARFPMESRPLPGATTYFSGIRPLEPAGIHRINKIVPVSCPGCGAPGIAGRFCEYCGNLLEK